MLSFVRILVSVTLICGQVRLTEATTPGVLCPSVGPTPPSQCDGRDGTWFPVSVVGSDTFCTLGPEVCAGDQLAACPGPSQKLPYGSKCTQLDTEAYGCIPKLSCEDGVFGALQNTSSPTTSDCESGCSIDSSVPQQCNGDGGWSPVSVVGSGTFCVKGGVCSANSQGACPKAQRGLPFGSSCVRVATGVLGCVENTKCDKTCGTSSSHDLCGTVADVSVPSPTPTTAPITGTPTTTPRVTPVIYTPTPTMTLKPTTVAPTVAPIKSTTPLPVSMPSIAANIVQANSTGNQTLGLNLVDTFTAGGFEEISATSPTSVDIPILAQPHSAQTP